MEDIITTKEFQRMTNKSAATINRWVQAEWQSCAGISF